MKNLILLFLVILPIVNLVILIGHIFFVKIFGGKIKNIKIGMGNTLLKIKDIEIRSFFCYGYEYHFLDMKVNSTLSSILVHFGGVIFTSISAAILYILLLKAFLPQTYLSSNLLFIFIISSIYELLPITVGGGDTSCKQVLQLLKKQKLEKMLKDEKNHEIVLGKLNEEVARLKEAAISGPEYMKKKYIAEVIHKAYIEAEIGRLEEAIKTIKSIYPVICQYYDRYKILYYNNLLYYCLKAGYTEEIDELHNNLTELLSRKENKAYNHADYDDTIETYKRYKNNTTVGTGAADLND